MTIGSLELTSIYIVGLIRRCLGRISLQSRTGLWPFCTFARIIFLSSPFYHSYLLICTLCWYKYGTRAIGSPELTQISIVAPIYGAVWGWISCSPVQVCGPFAPSQGLYFWALLSHSYLLICTLRWCIQDTMAIGSLELTQISIDGTIRRCLERGSLQARTGLWGFCTY